MAKKLLNEAEALKRIELSLKLNGKSFNSSCINCNNCKFSWGNISSGRPKWSRIMYNNLGQPVPNNNPQPEKYRWYCFKYKGIPYHAYLRFNVMRKNAEGVEISIRGRTLPDGTWTADPQSGETDVFILRAPGSNWRYSICRRFESAPRKSGVKYG